MAHLQYRLKRHLHRRQTGLANEVMDMDNLLRRYFGADDLAAVNVKAIPAATDRMLVDFGLVKDRSEKFALWTLLHLLDAAPDLDVAFENEEDREAARNFMDLMIMAERNGAGQNGAGQNGQ